MKIFLPLNFIKPARWAIQYAIFMLLQILYCHAQDTHQWNNMYSGESALMGGAVVAGVRDNSAVYYNPGALGFVSNPNLSIAVNGYMLDVLVMKDGAGKGIDLKSQPLLIKPLMQSGVLKLKKYEKHTFAYAVLLRNRFSLKTNARLDGMYNVFENTEAQEEYIAQYSTKCDLTETWAGISYAFRFHPKISVGATTFLAYRNQTMETEALLRVYLGGTQGFSSIGNLSSYDFMNFRMLWKVGMDFDLGKFKVGFAITTPSVSLGGRATVMGDVQSINVGPNHTSFTAGDRQDKLPTIYKSPVALSAGFMFDNNKVKIGVSAEWHAGIKQYNVVSPAERDFVRPTNADYTISSAEYLAISTGQKWTLNVATGIQITVHEKWRIAASFRTDFSNAVGHKGRGIPLTLTSWNIYHATTGFIYKRPRSDVNLVLCYSFAFKGMRSFINLRDPITFLGRVNEQQAHINYNSAGLILGYTFYFKK